MFSFWRLACFFCPGEHTFGDETYDSALDVPERAAGCSFPCELCNVVFSSVEDLKTHRKCHGKGPKEFTCEVCHTEYVNMDQLKTHMLLFHGEEFKHLCFECGRGFKSYPSYNNHKRLFHRPDSKCPVCDICGKIFPFESSLRHHYKRHSEVRAYVCNLCGKSYKHKGKLKMHNCLALVPPPPSLPPPSPPQLWEKMGRQNTNTTLVNINHWNINTQYRYATQNSQLSCLATTTTTTTERNKNSYITLVNMDQ